MRVRGTGGVDGRRWERSAGAEENMQLCRAYIVARRENVRFAQGDGRETERDRRGRRERGSPTEIATILPKPVPIV